jgi:TonB family protein
MAAGGHVADGMASWRADGRALGAAGGGVATSHWDRGLSGAVADRWGRWCVGTEMFERVITRPRSPRRTTAILLATALAHVAVIGTLVVAAMWKIERIPFSDRSDLRVAVQIEAPPAGGPPPGQRLEVQRVRQAKRPVKEPVQPVVKPPVADPAPSTTTTSTGGPPGGGDNPDGDPDATGTGTGTGTCLVEPCGPETDEPPAKPTPEPKVEAPPRIVDPTLAAGLRVAGDAQIYPPDDVRGAIFRDGRDQVSGTFKVCVGADGAIDSVKVLKGTGYAGYDRALVDGMREWRYRPYRVDGTAVPMCFVQVWRYRMTR